MKNLAILAALTVVSLPAAPALASAEPKAKDKRDEVVCKRQKRTDSRFTKKTCHTRAQWNEIAEQNQRDFAAQRGRPVIETRRDYGELGPH